MFQAPIAIGPNDRFEITGVAAVGDGTIIFNAIDHAADALSEPIVVRIPHSWLMRAGLSAEDWLAPWRATAANPIDGQRRTIANGTVGNIPYVVHEWHPGPTLLELMQAATKAGEIMPLKFGLAAAHLCMVASESATRKSADADFSPGGRLGPHRVRITPSGRIVLTANFGSPKCNRLLPVPTRPAEYAYMAPEYVRTGHCDARSDTWSICALLDTVAGAWNRVERPSLPETIDAILSGRPPRRNEFLPDTLADVVVDGLYPNPDLRLMTNATRFARISRALDEAGGPPTRREWSELVARLLPPKTEPTTLGAEAMKDAELAVSDLLSAHRRESRKRGHAEDREQPQTSEGGGTSDSAAWPVYSLLRRIVGAWAAGILVATLVAAAAGGLAAAASTTADGEEGVPADHRDVHPSVSSSASAATVEGE